MTSQAPARKVAVGLIRVSSDGQEFSAEDQQAHFEKWAEKSNRTLLRTFRDESISGVELDRPGIRRLLHFLRECPEKGVLAIWKRNRLVRHTDPRQGIALELKIEELGWQVEYATGYRNSGNLLVDTIAGVVEHHQGGQYLLDLSVDTLRGLVARFREGGTPGGKIPYGYRKLLEGGEGESRLIARRQRHSRAFGERARWVPGDPLEVRVIQRLFERYASGRHSMLTLCEDLNSEGIPSPSGSDWNRFSLRTLLRNPVYKGDLVWNRTTQAKFFRFAEGEIREVEKGRLRGKNPESDWLVVPGSHEPLVSAQLWAAVNARLDTQALRNGGARRSRTPYALSGLVRCGNCGAPMNGEVCRSGKYRYPKYVCASWGRNRGCHRFAIGKGKLEGAVLCRLKESLLPVQGLATFREELLRAYRRRTKDDAPLWDRDTLSNEARQLERKLERGSENLGLLHGAAATSLAERLNKWSARLEEIRSDLASPPQEKLQTAEQVVDEALALLTELEGLQPESSSERLAALFKRAVAGVELVFGRCKTPKRYRNHLESGTLFLLDSVSQTRLEAPEASGAASLPLLSP